MSKIVLTADVHLDYKDRLSDTIKSLEAISKYMDDNDITYCIIMGDLFNDRSAIATDAMNAAFDFFKNVREKGQEWIAFPGNHDMFLKYSWRVHSLKPLSEVLTVYERECLIEVLGQRFWILPYIHDEDIYMKAVSAIAEKAEPNDVLLTHIGVTGASLNECFLHKHWSFVTFENFPHRVYSGHFHCHQQVGSNMWYPGSPIPFRFDEGLVDHGFLVYDIDAMDHEFVKIGNLFEVGEKPPDFITIVDSSIDSADSEEVAGNHIKVSLGREYTNDERIALRETLLERGALSVAWTKSVEADVPVNDIIDGGEISLSDPNKLILTWFELDKPDHIDVELLKKLNKEVTERGA